MLHTADLCDQFPDDIQLLQPSLLSFGGRQEFHGPVVTLRVYEDSGLVKQVIAEPGDGRVLVVDGGGSLDTALTGGNMAALACKNGWAGMVFNGCIRDSAELADVDIGILALETCPIRPAQDGAGERDLEVRFLGSRIQPGGFLYADMDGVIVSERELGL